MEPNIEQCQICKRELGKKRTSKHHLIPLAKGGRHTETVTLHNVCHQKIHSIFTEKELKNDYNTIAKIIAHDEMIKFIKWVSKKKIDYYQSNKKMNAKKKPWKRH